MKSFVDRAELKRLIEIEQLTQAQTAAKLGCSVSCVERIGKKIGLKTQRTGPRSGPKHPDWKGGRIMVGGYWYIWTNTHPNRTHGNYVLEHRLTVEAKLGRYLLKSEVVHHKNGDRQDNRIENLEVFQSNADHLKHELTGRIPNWTDDGKKRIAEGVRHASILRKKAKSCD